MRRGTTAVALAAVLSSGIAGAQPRAARPLPTPAPREGAKRVLPTNAVDPALFPRRDVARAIVRGTTFHVSPRGDDAAAGTPAAPLRTISRALRAASGAPGNGVVVHGGTYAEGDDGDVALEVARDGLVVVAAPGEKATVKPGSPSVKNGLAIRASHVTWTGVSFEGFASCGIFLGKEGATVSDVVLAELSVAMPSGGDGIAVYLDGRAAGKAVVDGLLLERVAITGADLGFSVGSGPAKNLELRDVTVKNRTTGAGDSGRDAIAIEEGDNVLVDGADVSGAEGDGIDTKATRVAVLNAWVHGVDRNGIKLWKGGDVVNALVHDTGADAAVVFARGAAAGGKEAPVRYRVVSSTIAFHNRKTGAPSYVLTCGYDDPADAIELELVNVVFYRNTGGLALSKGTRTTVSSCAFLGNNGKVAEYAWDGSTSRSVEEADGAPALERLGRARGNLPFDLPAPFVQADARSLEEFRLAPGSGLVNAGAPSAPFPATDLVGAPRVQGGRPDVGALEAR